MAGGTNQTKPRGTGMPQGFTGSGQMMGQNALESFYNPTTKQTYTHGQIGAKPGEGWIQGKPPPGQEYAQWKDPNAPPKYGGWNPGGGGYGGWNPGNIGQQISVPMPNAPPDSAQMQALKGQLGTGGAWNTGGGQMGGLIGGGQQPQRRFPGMNIPGLLQYNQIDN